MCRAGRRDGRWCPASCVSSINSRNSSRSNQLAAKGGQVAQQIGLAVTIQHLQNPLVVEMLSRIFLASA